MCKGRAVLLMATRSDHRNSHYTSRHNNSFNCEGRTATDQRHRDKPNLPNNVKRKERANDYGGTDRKPPKLESFQDWSEYRSSSGKIYYYNNVTEVSQWDKPEEWLIYENGLKKKSSEKSRYRNHDAGSVDSGSQHSSCLNRPSSSSGERQRKRERYPSPSLSSTPSKRVHPDTPSTSHWDGTPRKEECLPSLSRSVSADGDGQLDLSKLPQLLVELADKYKIDLHEERAVDKLKLYLKKAVKPEVCMPDVVNSECSFETETKPSVKDEPMDTSPSSSRSVKEECDVRREEDGKVEDPLPRVSPSHQSFCREDLARHTKGWHAEFFEQQSWVWADTIARGSVALGQVMVDLKCARSLVRTAEIRTTLIDQRAMVAREQIRLFDPQKKAPNAGGGTGSTASGGSG